MPLKFNDDKSALLQLMALCVRQQAITWANVDPVLSQHMASLGHNDLTFMVNLLAYGENLL